MKIKEIMRGVTKISAEHTVSDSAKLMDEKNLGSLLVEESSKVIGIITERDILRKVVAKGKDPKSTSIKETMTSPIITISQEDAVENANELMTKNRIRRLLVKDNDKVIGIITLRDVSNNIKYALGRNLIGKKDFSRPGF